MKPTRRCIVNVADPTQPTTGARWTSPAGSSPRSAVKVDPVAPQLLARATAARCDVAR